MDCDVVASATRHVSEVTGDIRHGVVDDNVLAGIDIQKLLDDKVSFRR